MSQHTPSLPTNRAFVVQFRAPPAGAPLGWEGRVEHLVSGQVSRFASPEELVAFLTHTLLALPAHDQDQNALDDPLSPDSTGSC